MKVVEYNVDIEINILSKDVIFSVYNSRNNKDDIIPLSSRRKIKINNKEIGLQIIPLDYNTFCIFNWYFEGNYYIKGIQQSLNYCYCYQKTSEDKWELIANDSYVDKIMNNLEI